MPAKTLAKDDRRDWPTLVPRPTPMKKDGRGPVQAHPKATPAVGPHRPDLRLIAPSRAAARLHLFTYVIGNALFWTLWAAMFVTADRWYWRLIVPFVGWALVLAAHLWHVYRPRGHGWGEGKR